MSAIAAALYITLPSLLTISRAAGLEGNSWERVSGVWYLERVHMNPVWFNAEKSSWNYLFLLRKTLGCFRPPVSLIYDLYDKVLLEQLHCRPDFQWFCTSQCSTALHQQLHIMPKAPLRLKWWEKSLMYVKIVYDVILKGHVKFKQHRALFTMSKVQCVML